jgi:hypothetical protein
MVYTVGMPILLFGFVCVMGLFLWFALSCLSIGANGQDLFSAVFKSEGTPCLIVEFASLGIYTNDTMEKDVSACLLRNFKS